MSFNLKNIKGHLPSTNAAVILLIIACMFFLWRGKANWGEITSFLVSIVGLLLYGDKKNNIE